jgi:hypothetical protein
MEVIAGHPQDHAEFVWSAGPYRMLICLQAPLQSLMMGSSQGKNLLSNHESELSKERFEAPQVI